MKPTSVKNTLKKVKWPDCNLLNPLSQSFFNIYFFFLNSGTIGKRSYSARCSLIGSSPPDPFPPFLKPREAAAHTWERCDKLWFVSQQLKLFCYIVITKNSFRYGIVQCIKIPRLRLNTALYRKEEPFPIIVSIFWVFLFRLQWTVPQGYQVRPLPSLHPSHWAFVHLHLSYIL